MTLRSSTNIYLNRDGDQLNFYLAQVICALNQLFEKRKNWVQIAEYYVEVRPKQATNGNPMSVNVFIRPAGWPRYSFILIGFLVNMGNGNWVRENIRMLASHLGFSDPVSLAAHDHIGYTVVTVCDSPSLPDIPESSPAHSQ